LGGILSSGILSEITEENIGAADIGDTGGRVDICDLEQFEELRDGFLSE